MRHGSESAFFIIAESAAIVRTAHPYGVFRGNSQRKKTVQSSELALSLSKGSERKASKVQRGKAVSAYRRKTTIVIPGFTQ
jgi:hypothetical protein